MRVGFLPRSFSSHYMSGSMTSVTGARSRHQHYRYLTSNVAGAGARVRIGIILITVGERGQGPPQPGREPSRYHNNCGALEPGSPHVMNKIQCGVVF